MTTRLLPPEDWAKLAETECGPLWASLPAQSQVLVVEDADGAIVGSWILLPVWHAEALWIAPAHRQQASVGRRLWRGLWKRCRELGIAAVVTAAAEQDATVQGLLEKVQASRIDGHAYIMKTPNEVM